MVEVEAEVQMALLVVMDTIFIYLVVDVMVIMVPQIEVIVVLWMIHIELVQTASYPHNLKEDAGLINVLHKITNLSRV